MSDIAIRVEGLGKQYRIGRQQARYKTIREQIVDWSKSPITRAGRILRGQGSAADLAETIWALKDVSFEVKRGEVVGVIGRNGAGKTTLLKILSRITEPTTGDAWIHGRVGSLLEVGTGFHPELTGRENIFLNGAILGMKRDEIGRKFDMVVEFSGINKFIDTPVKYYSSGMFVRLAFSVAAHMETEILLVDEVLAVGDASFQKKCLGKMDDVARSGRTVLFVSHDMAAIEGLCSTSLLLEKAKLQGEGKTRAVISNYLRKAAVRSEIKISERSDRRGTGLLRFTDIRVRDKNGVNLLLLNSGKTVEFIISYRSAVHIEDYLKVAINFYDIQGRFLFVCNNELSGTNFKINEGKGELICRIEKFPLPHGKYYLHLYSEWKGIVTDHILDALTIDVEAGDFFGTARKPPERRGGVLVHHDWSQN